MIADILFIAFASILLLGALGVVVAKNPMYCVLSLILCFFNAAGLFLIMGAEFLGLLLIMVYVGAIAVMFLFVIMTIDIDFAKMKEGFATYLPVGLLVAGILLVELVASAWAGLFSNIGMGTPSMPTGTEENIVELGQVLFTNFILPFQGAGMILLIAMIGAIVLAHRKRTDVRRQDISKQIFRKQKDSMALTTPETGKGVTASHWDPKKVEK